jgi:hypothetical protein
MDGESLFRDIASSDLETFLRACPAEEVTGLAENMVTAYGGRFSLNTWHVPRSIKVRRMRGHDLIQDIIEDFSKHSSHRIGPRLTYSDCVKWIARRHGLQVPETESVIELERQILKKYDVKAMKSADFSSFHDKGSENIVRKVFWVTPVGAILDFALAANWGIATFIVLKIAVMRTLNRASALRAMVGN